MRNLGNSVRKRWRLLTDPAYRQFSAEVERYFSERGRTLPTDYSGFDGSSVVLDVGGYHGEWAAMMRSKYDCHVHVFEPHPEFARLIADRFSSEGKVTVHPFAIGPCDGELVLSDAGDGSSACTGAERTVNGRMVNATEMMGHIGDEIAVAKINIEGGEYDLLHHLIEDGAIEKIRTITVQFHHFIPGARAMRDQIRTDLAKTHRCSWNYDFVWEEWTRIER